MHRASRSRVLWAGAAVLAAAYSWVAASLRAFTVPIEVAVAVPAILVAVLSLVGPSEPPPDERPLDRPAVLMWAGLVALLAAWELVAYLSSPRRDHPTLSSMSDELMRTHPGRALAFVVWLLVGWVLLVRRGATAR